MDKEIQYGVATFKRLIQRNAMYIDKTDRIYKLISGATSNFFLSRPRRFGKTLLVDILSEIFQGNKELFRGFAIYNTDYDWVSYPVVRLSLNDCDATTFKDLNEYLQFSIQNIAIQYNCDLKKFHPKNTVQLFSALFTCFAMQHKQVVVLIDEYDYPILKNIDIDISSLEEIRETLKNFYAVLKKHSNTIRFLFLTGVGSFSRASIFSGINDLDNISASESYADLLGYTQDELEQYFATYIDCGAKKLGVSKSQFIDEIKNWYDGYRFSKKNIKVYNPSSINKFFKEGIYDFETYWISTGTPEFLIKLIAQKENSGFDIQKELLKERTDFLTNNILNLSQLDLITLLYQSGYITVSDYNPTNGRYKLDFPNQEVRISFLSYLAEAFLHTSDEELKSYHGIEDALLDKDPDNFIKEITKFFSTVPFNTQPTKEFTFQVALLALLYNSKQLKVDSEVTSSKGRSDIVVITDDIIYIIELKVDIGVDAAIKQIEEKKYAKKYNDDHRYDSYSIVAIAVEFDSKTREVKNSKIKTIR